MKWLSNKLIRHTYKLQKLSLCSLSFPFFIVFNFTFIHNMYSNNFLQDSNFQQLAHIFYYTKRLRSSFQMLFLNDNIYMFTSFIPLHVINMFDKWSGTIGIAELSKILHTLDTAMIKVEACSLLLVYIRASPGNSSSCSTKPFAGYLSEAWFNVIFNIKFWS